MDTAVTKSEQKRESLGKRLLIVADPLDSCRVASDTSLALAQGALEEGWEVDWCESHQIFWSVAGVWVGERQQIQLVSLQQVKSQTQKTSQLVETYSLVLIRKDPPFDENYVTLCWLLRLLPPSTQVMNPAHTLLNDHEKSLPWLAHQLGFLKEESLIPTFLIHPKSSENSSSLLQDLERFKENVKLRFRQTHDAGWILKPWLGHGGKGVTFLNRWEEVKTSLNSAVPVLLQPFLPALKEWGDRRVLMVHGENQGHFCRFPAEGKVASNLAQGGTPLEIPLTDAQNEVVNQVGKFLKHLHIALAGLDLIDTFVGEINVTSPTGLRTLEQLKKQPLSRSFFQKLGGGI